MQPGYMINHAEQSESPNRFYVYYCPACRHSHSIPIDRSFNGHVWQFSGSEQVPTLQPSVNVSPNGPDRCHHWVREGRIEFCSDSQHAMAGQTVDMPLVYEKIEDDPEYPDDPVHYLFRRDLLK